MADIYLLGFRWGAWRWWRWGCRWRRSDGVKDGCEEFSQLRGAQILRVLGHRVWTGWTGKWELNRTWKRKGGRSTLNNHRRHFFNCNMNEAFRFIYLKKIKKRGGGPLSVSPGLRGTMVSPASGANCSSSSGFSCSSTKSVALLLESESTSSASVETVRGSLSVLDSHMSAIPESSSAGSTLELRLQRVCSMEKITSGCSTELKAKNTMTLKSGTVNGRTILAHVSVCETTLLLFKVPEDEVEADDGIRLGSFTVVQHRGLSLRPHVATVVCQETVLAGANLTFGEHCAVWTEEKEDDDEVPEHVFTSLKHKFWELPVETQLLITAEM